MAFIENISGNLEILQFKNWLLEKRNLAESSAATYEYVLGLFFREVDDIEDIDMINSFLAKHTHKERCTHYYSVVKAFIDYKFGSDLAKHKTLIDNMIKPRRFKDVKMERRYLTDEKLIEILNNMDDDVFRIVALIQILTAARAGDVLSLTRDAIIEEAYEGTPTLRFNIVGKGMKRNVVYVFDPVAIQVIKMFLISYDRAKKAEFNPYYEDYLFLRNSKDSRCNTHFKIKRYTYFEYWRAVSKATIASNVVEKKYFSTHDFRRCFARKVWEKYKDIDKLKRVLNHEDISTTVRYLRQSGLQSIDIFKDLQG